MEASTITVFSKNTPGVLYRIANLFLRRKVNIESLTVSEIKNQGISRFTIVVNQPEAFVQKIAKQLARIVEVFDVAVNTDEDLIAREVALLKVCGKTDEELKEIQSIVVRLHGRIVEENGRCLVIGKTGTEKEIYALSLGLEPYEVKEFVRSGRISVMKSFSVPPKQTALMKSVSRNALSIDVSAIKQIQILANNTPGVISLAQGIPSFTTPVHIKEAAKAAIDQSLTDKYTVGYGILPLREAIVKKLKRDNGISVKPDQVIVTHGGIEALMAVFIAILDIQDELIILTPDYASHINQVSIATHGGKPVFVPLTETKNGWNIDPKAIEAAVTRHTKAILICNPCNPTGKVYTRKELKSLAAIAKKHNLYIICDEMYEYFLYDGRKHVSIGSFKDVADRVISVFGISKTYAMTGWRIGYIATSCELTKHIFKVHDSLVTCPTAVSQYAALAAITGPKDSITAHAKEYEKRRAITIAALSKMPAITCTIPEGAYYAFPKLPDGIDDTQFAIELIERAGVAVVPGSAFGPGGEGHIRICFAIDETQLKEGLNRLVAYINKKFL